MNRDTPDAGVVDLSVVVNQDVPLAHDAAPRDRGSRQAQGLADAAGCVAELSQVEVVERRDATALLGFSLPDVVVSARHGALETWWHHYTADDHARAAASLAEMAMAGFGERTFGSLSSGERQRVLLARALMADAPLIVLDEPSAGLDLGGREDLLGRLDALGADPTGPAQVLITHHPEEIPPSFTHVLLIRDGRVSAAGPIDEVLTSESLSDTFGLTLHLERRDGRFTAWAAT